MATVRRPGKFDRPIRRPDPLRAKAEADLAAGPEAPLGDALLHELRVHQVELAMQNEALRATQVELEESRDRYVVLYDRAPVGYLTLNLAGVVHQANLTAAALLGVPRTTLAGRSFARFMSPEQRERWYLHLAATRDSGAKQTCDLLLRPEGGAAFFAQLESVRGEAAGAEPVLQVTFSDVSARKRAEDAARREAHQLALRGRVAQAFLTDAFDVAFQSVLDIVLEASHSRGGAVGYVDGSGALVVATTDGAGRRAPESSARPAWFDETWRRVATDKTPVVRHAATLSEAEIAAGGGAGVTVPILSRDRAIGLLQVEDKASPYTREEVQTLERLAEYLAPILSATLAQRQAQELVTNVLASIDEGFAIIDREFTVISSNRAFDEACGQPAGAVVGHPCHAVTHHLDQPCHLRGVDCPLQRVFETGEPASALRAHDHPDGRPRVVEEKAFPLQRDDRGAVLTAVIISVDITERTTREAEIHRLAYFDPLTGLPNRRLLLDRLSHAFAVSARSGSHGAVLYLDVDDFKGVNDTFGHAAGDALLVALGRRLEATVRTGDSVSRQGGDEFVVLLEGLHANATTAAFEAGQVAEKVRAQLAEVADLRGVRHRATVSLGISLFCGHELPAEDVLKRADAAMYQAKRGGRNATSFFDPAIQAAVEVRAALATDLRHALEHGQLELHYQPQVDHDGRIIGAEALLRWRHPERGLVSPATFVPLAEETGLILPLGRWVLETACAQLRAWADHPATRALRLAINVSAREFRHATLVDEVAAVLAATGAPASQLRLELTESALLADVTDTVAKMDAMRALGVSISLDDFGTGYSSLSQLKRLPLDELKVDRAFVGDLGADPQGLAIVETIVTLGRLLGLEVVAEGVETRAQLALLQERGCDAYQGFLFSPAVPAAELERLLAGGALLTA